MMAQVLPASQSNTSADSSTLIEDTRDEDTPPPPPDGGYGWFCVLAQFLINGFTWGVVAVSSNASAI